MKTKLLSLLGVVLFFTQLIHAQPIPADGATGVSVTPDFVFTLTHSNDGITTDATIQISDGSTDPVPGIFNDGAASDCISEFIPFPPGGSTTQLWADIVAGNSDGDLWHSLEDEIQLAYNSTYYWRSAGSGGVGEPIIGGFIGWYYTFTTGLPPASLSSPLNGLTGVSVEPTLAWNATTNATSYKLYVDDADDFLTPLYEADQGTNLSLAFDETFTNFPLSNGTKYYWKVAAVDQHGNEYDSNTWHFTTVPAVNVYQTAPGSGTLVYDTNVTVYWYTSQLTGTMQYKVQLMRDDQLGTPGSAPTPAEWATSSSSTVSTLNESFAVLAGEKYWWRVVVLNSSDEVISYSTAWYFTVIGGVNVNITQSWPIGNPTIYTYDATCYWYTDQYALSVTYTVWYNKLGDTSGDLYIGPGDTDVQSAATGTNIYKTLTGLDDGSKYYWSVEASANGESTFSDIKSFTIYTANPLIVPFVTYPIGGVDVYTTSPIVYYYTAANTSGLYFDIDVATTSGGQDGSADYWTASAGLLNLQLTGLTPGQTYYFKIRSKNVAGVPLAGQASGWSSEYSFKVVGGVAGGHPVTTWPLGNPTEYTTQPTLYWYLEGSSLGLTKYTVKWYKGNSAPADWTTVVGSTADAGTDDINTLTTLNYQIPVVLDFGSKYYWAVASYDGATYSAWSEGSFTVYGSASGVAPTLTAPNNTSTITSRSTNVSWFINGSTVGFVDYTLVYSTSDVFAAGATTTVPGITDNFKALSNLTPGATYHWYVIAHYTQGDAASTTWTFTVDPGASSVQPMIGGPNNVSVNTVTPTLSWALPALSESQLTYQVEISAEEDFLNPMVYEGIQNPYQIISGLTEGQEYFWRVRSSTNNGDVSDYSGTGKFKVVGNNITATEENNLIPTDFNVMQNYPNPFNPATVINYVLPTAGYVTIKIYDMIGREIKTLVNSDMPAGSHSITWNGDDVFGNKVASGTYIYRVISGNNVAVKKMQLLK